MLESKVDLPAFGNPTSPTSASTLSSSTLIPSCPGSPGCAYSGAWLVADLKFDLAFYFVCLGIFFDFFDGFFLSISKGKFFTFYLVT